MTKRLLILVAILSILCSGAAAQTLLNPGNLATSSSTLTVNTTGASLIKVTCGNDGSTSPTVSSASPSATWYALTRYSAAIGYGGTTTYYAYGTSISGAAQVFTCNTPGSYPSIIVQAWSGTVTASDPLDCQNGTNNGYKPVASCTPTQAGDLFTSEINDTYNADTLSVPSASSAAGTCASGCWTMAGASGDPGLEFAAYFVNSGTSALNPQWGSMASGTANISVEAWKVVTVSNPSITTVSLPSATVGASYSQTLAATGGSGTGYTWSFGSGSTGSMTSAGAACAGLSLSSGGAITGTPTTSGTCSTTYKVTDSASNSRTATLGITVNATTTYALTLSSTNGTLSGSNCTAGNYASGTAIVCTAAANTGYTFSAMSGCSGSLAGSTLTVSMPAAPCTITASYTLNSWVLGTTTAGTGTGTITGCAGTINYGAAYSCTVTPTGGSTLASVSGCEGSGTTTYVGTMGNSACTVTATFNAAVTGGGTILARLMQ